jgi:hypothetical protein
MKSKKFSMKLTLNKKTIANLNESTMKEIHGGYKLTVGLDSCLTICYITGDPFCLVKLCVE